MDFRKLASLLVRTGFLILVVAVIWWYSFYSEMVGGMGPKIDWVSDVVQCLWRSGGGCAVVTNLASIGGKTAYQPMLFWIGAACFGLGVLLRYTAKD